MSASNAYKLALGGTAIAFVGTVLSWFLMRGFGRRSIYVTGLAMMTIYLMLIGILQAPASRQPNVIWGQAALCIIWLFTFSMSVGPVGWAIPAEVSSTRLRQKTVVLARNTYYLVNLVGGIIEPYLINPTEGNWKGYTGKSISLAGCWWSLTLLISRLLLGRYCIGVASMGNLQATRVVSALFSLNAGFVPLLMPGAARGAHSRYVKVLGFEPSLADSLCRNWISCSVPVSPHATSRGTRSMHTQTSSVLVIVPSSPK